MLVQCTSLVQDAMGVTPMYNKIIIGAAHCNHGVCVQATPAPDAAEEDTNVAVIVVLALIAILFVGAMLYGFR